ncbi:MAG TPA: chromate transporter [Clostridiales bacterium]|nr:chromate transporter [Clostridiales bacterium]
MTITIILCFRYMSITGQVVITLRVTTCFTVWGLLFGLSSVGTEFTDLITISEMTPGSISINSATFVGTRVADPGGALVSTLGCILPSCVIQLF